MQGETIDQKIQRLEAELTRLKSARASRGRSAGGKRLFSDPEHRALLESRRAAYNASRPDRIPPEIKADPKAFRRYRHWRTEHGREKALEMTLAWMRSPEVVADKAQRRYDKTRSHGAWRDLRDARTAAMAAGE